MAFKKSGNKNLKIVAATMMAIFSLFTCFTGAFAWFTATRQANNASDDFKVDRLSKLTKISYHQFTGSPSSSACSFNKTPFAYMEYDSTTKQFSTPKNGSDEEMASFNLEMAQYNPLEKNKPVLVLAEFDRDYNTASNSKVTVAARTDTADFMGVKDNNHQPKYVLGATAPTGLAKVINDEDYYPLSSVVGFRSFALSSSEYTTWSGESAYNVTIANTMAPDHNFSDADTDADESSFEPRCTIYDSDNEALNTDGDDETYKTVKYVAIVVDYNDAAIEYIYSTYLGDDVMENTYEYVLNFMCDWVWEIG